MEQTTKLPLIGERAPVFKAETIQGPIHFPDDFAPGGDVRCLDGFLCLKKDPS